MHEWGKNIGVGYCAFWATGCNTHLVVNTLGSKYQQ